MPINHKTGEAHARVSQFLAMLESEADWPAVASDSPKASQHSARKSKIWRLTLLSQKACLSPGFEKTNDDLCVYRVWRRPSGSPAVTLVSQLSIDESQLDCSG